MNEQPIKTEYKVTIGDDVTTHPDAETALRVLLSGDGRKKAKVSILETYEREVTALPAKEEKE
jgi:hypothetical protein